MSTPALTRVPVAHETFEAVLTRRLSRRDVLSGGVSVAVLSSLGLVSCSDDGTATAGVQAAPALGFTAVAKSLADRVTVPAGYTAKVLYALGDPIKAGIAAYINDGTDGEMDQRAGDHHDAIAFFGLDADGDWDRTASTRGLLVMNHEQVTQQFLHVVKPDNTAVRPEAEVRKEMAAHGVAIVEVAKAGSDWATVPASPFNRRITPTTPIDIHGPVRGSTFVVTQYDPTGETTRGTINNCAHGVTPWGTYLTCEENWNGYFKRGSDAASRTTADNTSLTRYGLAPGAGGASSFHRNWSSVAGDEFQRWVITVLGASTDGADDYRNEANTMGWVVEIDPFDPTARPRKRTTMGRFAHEGAWIAPPVAGEPVVLYMGDDNRNDYIYKFVSEAAYDPDDRGLAAGDKYLDRGTLYAARFKDDGTGEWLELSHNVNGLNASNTLYPFVNQAAVLVNTRLAADYVGATKMDRPEWAAVNPFTGEVYMTLTNNRVAQRPVSNLDAANPRAYADARTDALTNASGNVNGHIIRWRETGVQDAVTFRWDIFLFGAQADAPADTVNLSGLTANNDFSSPDGLWFDERGLLWIQTDDGAYTDTTNCMMLAARPGQVGDGGARSVTSTVSPNSKTVTTYVGRTVPETDLRRFLVGPKECEITGVCMTPDGKSMFVNIQHPGEDKTATLGTPATYGSRWPIGSDATADAAAGVGRPRSATVVIQRSDGGVIGL